MRVLLSTPALSYAGIHAKSIAARQPSIALHYSSVATPRAIARTVDTPDRRTLILN